VAWDQFFDDPLEPDDVGYCQNDICKYDVGYCQNDVRQYDESCVNFKLHPSFYSEQYENYVIIQKHWYQYIKDGRIEEAEILANELAELWLKLSDDERALC
jgi:hypothetical protein